MTMIAIEDADRWQRFTNTPLIRLRSDGFPLHDVPEGQRLYVVDTRQWYVYLGSAWHEYFGDDGRPISYSDVAVLQELLVYQRAILQALSWSAAGEEFTVEDALHAVR